MLGRILCFVVLLFIFSCSAYSQETISTFKVDTTAASAIYLGLVVEDGNNRNVFPTDYPKEVQSFCGSKLINFDPDRGGYVSGQLDPSRPNETQIAIIHSGHNHNNLGKYHIYFWTKGKNDKFYRLYRMDITDGEYIAKKWKGSKMPDYRSIVINECFKKKTQYTKAFERAKSFWQTGTSGTKEGLTKARDMCFDNNAKACVSEKLFQFKKSEVESFVGEWSDVDHNYRFSVMSDKWWVDISVVKVGNEFKIKYCMGESREQFGPK